MSEIARCRMSSNVFERWLISITDMPTPGSAIRSRCASSSTGRGNTAGPAAKLKMRVVVGIHLYFHKLQTEDVFVPPRHRLEQRVGRRGIEVDTGDGRLRALEDDVLGLLHVQLRLTQVVEHVGEHARPVAVTND